jgi:hypothetical protein
LPEDEQGVVVKLHEEIVSFRGVTAGENVVTVHVYSKKDEEPVRGTIKLIKVKPFKEIIVKEKVFEATGEEKTAFRFTTDASGEVIEVNELQANLVNSIQ